MYIFTGCPISYIRSSVGLNYNFQDLSENFRRMNHFVKLNKANLRIFLQEMLGFSNIYIYFGELSNMIWDALYLTQWSIFNGEETSLIKSERIESNCTITIISDSENL